MHMLRVKGMSCDVLPVYMWAGAVVAMALLLTPRSIHAAGERTVRAAAERADHDVEPACTAAQVAVGRVALALVE